VNNLRFAVDIRLLTRSGPDLQDITTQIDEISRKFGLMLRISRHIPSGHFPSDISPHTETKTMVIEKRKETPLFIEEEEGRPRQCSL